MDGVFRPNGCGPFPIDAVSWVTLAGGLTIHYPLAREGNGRSPHHLLEQGRRRRAKVSDALELLQGTVDVLILKTLTWGAMHGYAVSRSIRERTDDVLQVDDAALYQALHRLAGKGYVRAEWGVSENNRRARFYELTPAGRKALRSESVVWRRYAEAVFKVLEPA